MRHFWKGDAVSPDTAGRGTAWDWNLRAGETADLCENREDLEKRVRRLMSDPALGKVLRVKGHMQDLERNWYEVSGFPGGVRVEPAETGRGICSVVGRQLRGEVLAEAFIPRKSVREKKYV